MNIEQVDTLIVGAGLSGIGSAVHLRQGLPQQSVLILEARERLGGTWDLFRYPGIRSDSDMHTLGYSFKPWTGAKAIADGPSILRYVQETAQEFGVLPLVRFGHKSGAGALHHQDHLTRAGTEWVHRNKASARANKPVS